MQRLEVSGAVRLIYRSLGVKGLIFFLLYTGYRANFIGVWDQCTMNIVSCSGLEDCWLCRGTLFFFLFELAAKLEFLR